jgi:hypothetical protein
MNSPYDELDPKIKRLIRQGCSTSEVSKQLLSQYPQFVDQAAQFLKHIQSVERGMR